VYALIAPATGQVVQVRQPGQAGQPRRPYIAIPGLNQLGLEHVQKELELIDEQKEKLQEIASRYREEQREAWADWRNVPAEERQAKIAEIREQSYKLAEETRKEAEKVLMPHQLKALKEMIFRSRIQYSLRSSRIQEELGLDEEQLDKLEQLNQELQQRIRELNKEMVDKTLQVLSPEQREKLRETSWETIQQGYGYGRPAGNAPGKKTD
jgi:hypothetical protein